MSIKNGILLTKIKGSFQQLYNNKKDEKFYLYKVIYKDLNYPNQYIEAIIQRILNIINLQTIEHQAKYTTSINMKVESQIQRENESTDIELVKEQQEMYDYLFMRYYELYSCYDSSECSSLSSQQSNRNYPQLRSHFYMCASSSSVLELCMENRYHVAMKDQSGLNNQQQQQQKRQARRVVLAQILVKDYPSVFLHQSNNQLSLQDIIFQTIFKHSIISISKFILSSQLTLDNQIFSLIGPQLNFLILAVAIHQRINFKRAIEDIKSSLKYFIKKIISTTNLLMDVMQVFQNYLSLVFEEQHKTQKSKLCQKLTKQYSTFKLKYNTSQVICKNNILQLHYLKQTLSNANKSPLSNLYNLNSTQFKQNQHPNQPNSIINIFNYVKNHNKSITVINQQLLMNFLTQPYQTSLFVLFKLLSQCRIRNIDKFFIKNPADFRDFILINPLAFLLIDPKLITQSNAESLSLSLWIIMDVWIKNSLLNKSPYIQAPKKHHPIMKNQQTNQSNDVSLNNNSTSKDPRQIYRIKKESYPISAPVTQPREFQQQIKKRNTRFEDSPIYNYEYGLMTTMIIFLLTLQVETTMIKYYPIQNDLLCLMVKADILPSLLVNSKFAMKVVEGIKKDEGKRKYRQHQLLSDQGLLQRIQQAQTVDELQYLEHLLHQQKLQTQSSIQNQPINQTQQSAFTSQFNQWSLPWMCLIETKSILPKIMNYYHGLTLTFKLLQRRPNTLFKIYEYQLINNVIRFIGRERAEHMQKTSKSEKKENVYTFKGNKNARMRKSIDYQNKPIKNVTSKNKSQNGHDLNGQQKKEELKIIRKIFDMHKGKGMEEKLYNQCEQMLKQLQSKMLLV